MLRKLVYSVVLVLLAGYSYSNSLAPYYGFSNNAYRYANPWNMGEILPDPSGLSINNVFYTYTPIKETASDFEVDIGNWNADKSGYVWKETDNWDGAPGGIAIIKNIPLPYIHRSQWGDGFLTTTGNGTVEDATVIYSYKVDPCYNPQFDPNCPGFVPPKVEEIDISFLYDTVAEEEESEAVDTKEVYDEKEEKSKEELDEEEAKEEEKRKERLEKAMSATDNSQLFAESFAQGLMLQQMNNTVNVTTYLNKVIEGGSYKETVQLDGGNLPDNKNGRRMNFTTQKLHNDMVSMQYKDK